MIEIEWDPKLALVGANETDVADATVAQVCDDSFVNVCVSLESASV